MKSSTTPSFWRAYRALTPEIQTEARKAYQLWKANPRHPSLHFERKEHIGRFALRVGGGLWRVIMKAYCIGFGLARTMSIRNS
jgi:hypothetical protein